MVSIDHFAQELQAQLRSATEQGATHILINSTELSRSVPAGTRSTDACCEAMEQQLKHGDIVVQGKASGAGMIVRYQLPRTSQ